MQPLTITCPHCQQPFELLDAQHKQLRHDLELDMHKRLEAMSRQYEKDLAVRTQSQLQDLLNQVQEKQAALKESQSAQLQLSKQMRELQERQQGFDLEVEQEVLTRLNHVQADATKKAEELYRFKMAEKDKMIKDIEEQLAIAKRTAEQGSQQTQGEVVELAFESTLKAAFPLDRFEAVPKGVDGADLVQVVMAASARSCGTIVWEFKNTKAFQNDWVAKIKRDQQKAQGDAAVLVTRSLPRGSGAVDMIDGVLVVSFELVLPIAKVLRRSLEDLSFSKLVQQGQDEKMRLIYEYLTGNQFRQKIKSVVSAFTQMKNDLETEKRAFKKMWAAREKMLEQVIDASASLYGDIEGIAGSFSQEAPLFELPGQNEHSLLP